MQISGLSSGIDTASMVKQLMSIERMAGNQMTRGRNTAQSLVTAFTNLNTSLKKLGEASEAFVPTSLTQKAAWTTVSAKSSNEAAATVTTTDGAQAGSLSFTVSQIAQAGAVLSEKGFAADDVLNGGAAFEFSVQVGDGESKTISVGENSKLADVVAALNQQTGGEARATMVQVATGTYKLQITSAHTGANSNVNVTDDGNPPVVADLLGGFRTVAQGQDTILRIGDATNGYDVTSSTREVKDLLPGVTINPLKVGESTTVDITSDVDGLAGKVEEMIKAANATLSQIQAGSKYDKDNPSRSGAFVGNSLTRDLSSQLARAITGGVDPSAAGISIDRNGTLTFDKTKFTAAYTNDSQAVQGVVDKIASNFTGIVKQATDASKGSITTAINSQQSSIQDYGKRLEAFEHRMTLREATLKSQFNAMESMLSRTQAQGNWLQGQLAGLYSGMG